MSLLRSVTSHLEDLLPDEHQRREPQPLAPGVRFEAVRFGQRSVLVRLLGVGDYAPAHHLLDDFARRVVLLHVVERFTVGSAGWASSTGLLVTGRTDKIHLRSLVPAGIPRFFPVPLALTRSVEGRRVTLTALGEYGSGPSDYAALHALRHKLALALRVDPRKRGAADLAASWQAPVPPLGLHLDLERMTTGFLAL